MWLAVTLALAGDEPGRWLEHERRAGVREWWAARTEESAAWLEDAGRQQEIAARLLWERENDDWPVSLVDRAAGVTLWAKSAYVPADPVNGARVPRRTQTLYVQADGDTWPGTPLPLDPDLDVCASSVLNTTDLLLGVRAPRTGDERSDRYRECAFAVYDRLTGETRDIWSVEGASMVASDDGTELLVCFDVRDRRTALARWDLETGGRVELLRSRRDVAPVAWRDDRLVAVSTARTGRGGGRPLQILAGPLDDLDWLGSRLSRPWFGDAEALAVRGDEILLRTDFFGPGTNLVRVDPEKPRWGSWRVVTGERPGMDLTSARIHGDTLLTVWSLDGLAILEEAPYDGGPGRIVDLGAPATWIGVRRTLTAEALVTVWSPVGTRYYARDLAGGYTLVREVATSDAELRPVQVKSADGTMVPVTLVVPPGEAPPGGRPVLLDVYGGFGISQDFGGLGDLRQLWLAAGGAVGTVHARGGRERGDAWHESAKTVDHERTYEDLIAAARGLVELGIAAPGKVAVQGASNGGLTVAGAAARDPAAFGAVIATAGVYDLVRGPRFGRWWGDEYGRLRDEEEGAVLRAASLVDRVPAGPLPPIWLHTGERDPVVAPAHTYKLAEAWAKLPGGPVLLDVDPWGTHGARPKVSKDLKERRKLDGAFVWDAEAARVLGFLFEVFDMEVPPIPPVREAGRGAAP